MRCGNCKACVLVDYECGVWDCDIDVPEDKQVEFSDGEYGCKLHWKTIQKAIREKNECYTISLAEGQKLWAWISTSRTKETENCTSDRTGITSIPIMTMKYGVISGTQDLQNATATIGKKRRRIPFSSG